MEEFITTPEAEARYGVTRRTIRRLYDAGLLKLHKQMGERSLLVLPADLEAALKRRKPRGRPRKDAPVASEER